MSPSQARATLLPVSILLLLALVNPVNAGPQHPVRKRPVKQEQPAPPPPPPPPPPTPEQMPARPPTVTFSHGLLTIVAENSTLGDILRAVRTQTKAAVEIPPGTNERVVTHLGPGPARDVLAALLNGSHYNYVMLESATRAGMVDRLILTSKSGGPVEAGSAPIPPRQDDAPGADMEPSESPADIAEQPNDNPAENPASEDAQPAEPAAQSPIKTPEQLLRELQMQQQQQQQQGGQPAPNRPPQ